MLMTTLLAGMPDLSHRVLSTHVRDGHGNCRECPGVAWPCQLHQIANEAEQLGQPRRRPARRATTRIADAPPRVTVPRDRARHRIVGAHHLAAS